LITRKLAGGWNVCGSCWRSQPELDKEKKTSHDSPVIFIYSIRIWLVAMLSTSSIQESGMLKPRSRLEF
jgi:hypothetical protein